MKATLSFDLEDLSDASKHRAALDASALVSALWAIDQHLRSRLKYAELSEEARAELQAARDLVPRELLDDV